MEIILGIFGQSGGASPCWLWEPPPAGKEAPVLTLFYLEGSASAWDLPRVSAVNWKAAFNMPVRKQMQISSFSLFWVRFMPPPHAQPPGSNKSQRGRECCKKQIPCSLCVQGREKGCVGISSCFQASQTWCCTHSHSLPALHWRPPTRTWGFTFNHPPSLPPVQGCVCPVWDGTINLILAEGLTRDEPFPCSMPKSLQHLMDPPGSQAWAALQS